MNKLFVYGFLALVLLGSVVALTDYRTESYQQNTYGGASSLKAYDEGCPRIEVHKGYFVQQIYVRTSQGFVCQFPSGNKHKVVEPVVAPVVVEEPEEPEPVCEDVEICEEVCTWDWGWYRSGHHWKFGWHEDCEEECTTELVCESVEEVA
jgi:hypothetical protein